MLDKWYAKQMDSSKSAMVKHKRVVQGINLTSLLVDTHPLTRLYERCVDATKTTSNATAHERVQTQVRGLR